MDTNKAISVDAWNALASLRVLLRHKIAQHSTAELRQDLLPEFARDQDLEVAVALEKVLQHLAANSRRRFESNVDRLVICPACNQLTRQKGVMTAVYYYALNDVDYSEPHDQHVRRLNFNRWKHSFDSFALSPRLVEKLTCNNCDGRFDSSNGDKIRCKERLTDVRSASHVPRWIILYLCHDETNVKDLRATPHARQPFHGYWEQENRSGRYHFNTSSQRPYKLRAYALLAKPNYDHAVLRQAIELNGTPVQWLQLDDEDMVTIDHNDFYREGQKIEFLLYESVDQGDVIASGSESNLPRLRERKQ
ncbi:hypothetical protein AAVH_30981 [Aphelenchoides avenae]|nr:hypothetical protein AAVH_30981 [Aphelenchus avenae]